MLKVGDKAPFFTGIDDQGKKVELKNFCGKKVILYFYPKDNTPGCTQESCDFRDVISRIKKKDTVVLGVSPDSVASHQKFKVKFSLRAFFAIFAALSYPIYLFSEVTNINELFKCSFGK